MTVFDTLLQQIIRLDRNGGARITWQPGDRADFCSYFIGGGMELDSGYDEDLLSRIERGGIEAVYMLQWGFANSASIIESGKHFFLSEEAAMAWRDGNENAAYHTLEVRRLTEDEAQREASRLGALPH